MVAHGPTSSSPAKITADGYAARSCETVDPMPMSAGAAVVSPNGEMTSPAGGPYDHEKKWRRCEETLLWSPNSSDRSPQVTFRTSVPGHVRCTADTQPVSVLGGPSRPRRYEITPSGSAPNNASPTPSGRIVIDAPMGTVVATANVVLVASTTVVDVSTADVVLDASTTVDTSVVNSPSDEPGDLFDELPHAANIIDVDMHAASNADQ